MNIKKGDEVHVSFLSGRSITYSDVRKVDTDIDYSMYQITDKWNRQSFIDSKVIERIEFGREVYIVEH
ncbi:hypothetical protein [Macrococcoides canis]|uniref:hypothetical protein n=1 Tax=Macrococcoides canis TaxID=1855823 RepID=UPI00105F3951|nr:hypothetical protein [Macrococcus canis]TDM23786.1 hypothetical protein ETI02_05140 [Macrococcus canis]